MEEVYVSEKLGSLRTTQRYNPEDCTLHRRYVLPSEINTTFHTLIKKINKTHTLVRIHFNRYVNKQETVKQSIPTWEIGSIPRISYYHVFRDVWPQTGFGLVNRFIDHLQVVTTSNYNTIADFHTTNHSPLPSQSAFTSRYLITALNNGYSSAMFSLDASC
jgi:hypothetical protein